MAERVKTTYRASPFSLSSTRESKTPFLSGLQTLGLNLAERALGLHQLGELYRQIYREAGQSRLSTDEFVNAALNVMGINCDVNDNSLARIPRTGSTVVVANHPFGGLEAVVLMKILRSVRPDVKFMANFILERVSELDEFFIYVDPFGNSSSAQRNRMPLRECVEWLRGGGLLCVFPSGTVSHLHPKQRIITDPVWSPTVSRVIRMGKAAVLPIYFPGRNSNFFQAAGLIHPALRTALIPRELYNKRNSKVEVKIGNLIPFKKIEKFGPDEEIIDYLRLRTYILGNRDRASNVPKALYFGPATPTTHPAVFQEKIIEPISSDLMAAEVAKLAPRQLLDESGELAVYAARAGQIRNILQEIGRLREITFRLVQEGTGKSIDLDRFDRYYIHLFIWNKETKEVVGAYRLVKTDRILIRLGKNGLYSSTLFNYRPGLLDQLGPALELGRSFVREEYQKNYTPLMLLWRGIGQYVVRNPRYRILFGPVSINNQYDSLSRQLITTFLKANNYLPELARLIRARNPMPPASLVGMDLRTTSRVVRNIEEVSELLNEIESTQKSIPVLLKQYLKVGGKLMGFNVDPNFGDVLDGLIFVDMVETEPKLLDRYLGEEGARSFLAFHGISKDVGLSKNATVASSVKKV